MNSSFAHSISLIFLVRFLAATGVRIIYPLAPFLAEEFQLEPSDIGLILALSEVSAIPALILASLADKWNIRVISFLAFLLMGMSFAMMSLTTSKMFTLILTARVCFIFGYQVIFTTSLSVLFGVVPEKEKLKFASFIELSFGCSALIGVPLVSYAFNILDFKVIFLIIAGLFVLVGIDILVKFPQSHNFGEATKNLSFKEIISHLNHSSVYFYNFNSVFLLVANNGVFTVLSFLLRDDFEIEISNVGLTFFIIGISEVVSICFLGYLLKKLNLKRMYCSIYLISILTTVVSASISFASSHLILLILMFLYFGSSQIVIVFTIAETEAYVLPYFRSSVLAFHSVCMFVGRSSGAFLGEYLYNNHGSMLAFNMFGLSMLVSVVLLFVGERKKRNFETADKTNEESTTESEVLN